MDSIEQLFRKWQGWLNGDLLWQVQNLIVDRHFAKGFQQSLKPYGGREVPWADLVFWMSRNHIANMGTAIRRLGDTGKDVVSLHRLLEDVKRHADVVTIENLHRYRGEIRFEVGVMDVAKALDDDLKVVKEKGEKIKVFVNKNIAHNVENSTKVVQPTYGEFEEAVNAYHWIYRKWALLLAGSNCQIDNPNPNDLLPMDLPDYTEDFEKMWRALDVDKG
jgi:AbiU2